VNYQWFEENIGALAGGNVVIQAGGDISELSVAVPTIGRQVGGSTYAENSVQVTGGGSLSVQSGGDITGGSYFIGAGTATLNAGNSIAAGAPGAGNSTGLAPILALGDASIDVNARASVTLESVLNPFLLPQATVQSASARTLSLFSTYSEASAVNVLSTAGDITFLDQPAIDGLPTQFNSMRFTTSLQDETFLAYPGTVNAAALAGNVNIDGNITLWPSATGNLNLLAAHNVVFAPLEGSVLMSGLAPSSLPNPNAPVQSLIQQYGLIFNPPAPGASYTPIHSAAFSPGAEDDPNPVRVVALDGSVTNATLAYIPKPIDVVAGQDITELSLRVNNLASTDISLISAGQDISYTSPRDINGILTPESQGIIVEGPGSLLVEAGRNVNLGTSSGIVTVGNLYNPSLAAGGASVSVLTGATIANADLTDFIADYLANSATYDSLLISYVQARTSAPVTTKAGALAVFDALSPEQQFQLCEQILYDEIRTGGRAAAAAGPNHGNYSRSFLALSTLFPNSTTAGGPDAATSVYPGSLSLFFSQIYTFDGGDISLLTPGGSVDVGLSTPPLAFGISKTPSQLGIVAQSTGNINSVSYGNFLVNQSRVFAADGGDILVWSTDGNVDAGRGAKTAISAPAPTVTFNAQGQIQTNFPAALQGSGIQALATTDGVSPGDVDLYAPQGVVNASDAGIVAGNLTIGATAVLGRNNITVSGVSVGVPVDASGLGASLAGSSSVGSSAATAANLAADSANKADTATPLSQNALGFLDVFIMGLGEDTCKPEDVDCLKRQKVN
jgi:filamentous hemagglutinin